MFCELLFLITKGLGSSVMLTSSLIHSAGHRLSAVKFDDVGFSGGKTYE